MRKSKNWSAVSIVCVIQIVLCAMVLIGILLFQWIGGEAYETAKVWYEENASDTVLVYPDTDAFSNIENDA